MYEKNIYIKNTVAHSRMNDPVFVGIDTGAATTHVCSRSSTRPGWRGGGPAGGLHHRVLTETGTAAGEPQDSSWSGYHRDVMGEAARGPSGRPYSPPRGGENVTDCRLSSGRRRSSLRAAAVIPCFLIRNSCIQRFVKLRDRRVYPNSVALPYESGYRRWE